MLIVFSGTGNSLRVARELQRHAGGETVILGGERLLNPGKETLEVTEEGEPVIWVMPVYSWGIPPVMERFISKVRFKGAPQCPHYVVLTCGDDIGYADNCWRKLVGRRGWTPRGSFSVAMPNTYVCMKGFDVDSTDIEAGKMAAMPGRVEEIASAIKRKFSDDDVVRGAGAWWKTYLIRPFFNAFCTSPHKFRASDRCTGCSTCALSCPMDNITMKDSRPAWGCDCAFCLRCYHICPHHAVEYGDTTLHKGQKQVFRSDL